MANWDGIAGNDETPNEAQKRFEAAGNRSLALRFNQEQQDAAKASLLKIAAKIMRDIDRDKKRRGDHPKKPQR